MVETAVSYFIHSYFGVDLEVLWRTIQEDLPPLRDSVRRFVADLESDG